MARTPRRRKESELMGTADTGNGGTDKRVVCWSRQVCRAETDTGASAGTETHLKSIRLPRQLEFEYRTSFEDNDAVGRVQSTPLFWNADSIGQSSCLTSEAEN